MIIVYSFVYVSFSSKPLDQSTITYFNEHDLFFLLFLDKYIITLNCIKKSLKIPKG